MREVTTYSLLWGQAMTIDETTLYTRHCKRDWHEHQDSLRKLLTLLIKLEVIKTRYDKTQLVTSLRCAPFPCTFHL